jgi:hypothetical protein
LVSSFRLASVVLGKGPDLCFRGERKLRRKKKRFLKKKFGDIEIKRKEE